MSFEADITDSFISDRVSNKTMNTANIGQTQFENGDYILPDQSTFLLNGDATLQATKENGFIIDNFQFCGIFNGDISVEFLDSNGNLDYIKYNDYRLEQLSKVKDKVKYTITLNLTKKDKKWVLDEVDEVTLDKIHGMYIY